MPIETVASSPGPEDQQDNVQPQLELIHDPQSADWTIAENIEAQVFIDSGYVKSAEELGKEYEKYLSNTDFVLVKNEEAEAVGAMRLITYDPAVGIKTFDDVSSGRLSLSEEGKELLSHINPSEILEVGTIAVKPEFRNTPASILLYGAMHGESIRRDRRFVVASFDEKYFGKFQKMFGPACHQIGPGIEYMGSKTVPALLDIPELYNYVGTSFPQIQQIIAKAADSMR